MPYGAHPFAMRILQCVPNRVHVIWRRFVGGYGPGAYEAGFQTAKNSSQIGKDTHCSHSWGECESGSASTLCSSYVDCKLQANLVLLKYGFKVIRVDYRRRSLSLGVVGALEGVGRSWRVVATSRKRATAEGHRHAVVLPFPSFAGKA